MITLNLLKEILEKNFCEPFLEKGSVEVFLEEDDEEGEVLNLSIGRRSIAINKDGKIVDSGTYLGN